MSINIKRNQLKRVVIVGGGLGGLRLAEDLSKANLQVVLIDKNNFHQFPPLIYQIASAGIDPSSISFPFRQIFRKRKNFYFRMAEARAVFPDKKILQTFPSVRSSTITWCSQQELPPISMAMPTSRNGRFR